MKKNLIKVSGFVVGLGSVVVLPMVAFAQVTTTSCGGGVAAGTLQSVLCSLGNILLTLIPILVVLGIVYFIWGVITYVIASDEEAKTAGRNRMIYGIIGLFVIVAVWGLVNVLTTTFGVDNAPTPPLPTVGI